MRRLSPGKGLLLLVVSFVALAQPGLAQVTPPPTATPIGYPAVTPTPVGSIIPGQPTPTPNPALATTPKPYDAAEFPDWANKLRRYEVVSLGTFPITFLVSGVVFDVGRWAYMSISGDSNATTYAPLFFAGSGKPALTQNETLTVIGIALGFSLSLGLIDFLIENGKPTPTPSAP